MNIQLIQGQFKSQDAIDILTQMIHIKVRYQENKINASDTEEDIKMRETRIKKLQKDLFEARKYIETKDNIVMQSEITL